MNGKPTSIEYTRFKKLSTSYYAHHFICPYCIAAGKGYGEQCSEGHKLWIEYQKIIK
jgi:hypothetical protein